MSDDGEKRAGAVATVIAHPNLATAKRKILSRKIAAKRTEAIVSLDRAVEYLERLSRQPAFHSAEQDIRECQLVIQQLEALDPSMPPSAEEIRVLYDRLGKLFEALDQRNPTKVQQQEI